MCGVMAVAPNTGPHALLSQHADVELARHAFFGGLLARAMPPGGGDELANAKLAAEPPFKPGANTHLVRKSKMQSHAKKRLSLMVA